MTTPPPPEHVAAIAAAIAVLQSEPRAVAPDPPDHLSMWVEASRRSAQRANLQRGPWRLSGRIGRRSRT
ncbi:MAG: hypothetical protein ACRDV7_12030 [Acidimicrobiia bacterium]|jgi:hypothetical protein